jgi:tetratricopeptide (TPR) repeat protein
MFRGLLSCLVVTILSWMTPTLAATQTQKSDKVKPPTIQEQATKLWKEAEELFDTGKTLEGVAKLENVVKLDPKDVQAWTLLGWHHAYNLSVDPDLKLNEEEQVKKGIEILRRGIVAVPRSADLRFELGSTYYDRVGDMQKATNVFRETLRLLDEKRVLLLDPDEKRPLRQWRRLLMRNLAHAYERKLDFDGALKVYDRMIEEYDDEDVARFMANYLRNDYGKAREYFNMERYKDALSEIDAALSRRVIAIGLYLKAECHLKLGEIDEAKKAFIALVNHNPRERVALNKIKELSSKQ